MQTITLADGTPVPHVAFGSGTALLHQDCSEFILAALKAGFTHIDTAQRYRNEESVGDAIKTFLSSQSDVKRSDLFITTKIRTLEEGETIESSLRGSLKRLGLDAVDSFLIHAPIGWEKYEGGIKAVWKEVIEMKKKGLAKTVGVSNFNKKHLEEIMSDGLEPPSINQIEYHLLVAEKLEPLLEFSKANGIVTSSYSGLYPILPTLSTEVARVCQVAPEELRCRILEVSNKLAAARGPHVTPGHIMMKWILKKGVFVVTSSSKTSRIQEYALIDSVPDLSDEEIEELRTAVGGVHVRSLTVAAFMDEE